MVKRQKRNWLCRLRLHKWRNFGDKVVITWKEPGLIAPSSYITQTKTVLTEKECLRCGIKMKRRLANNLDGTISCIGWDPIPEPGFEESIKPKITPSASLIQKMNLNTLLKYFVHGVLYSVLGILLILVWAFILFSLVAVGYILGLIIGLGLFILMIGGLNAIITSLLWFPVKMAYWDVFFHGLALSVALLIVNAIFIMIPNILFPTISTLVITFVLGAFLDGMIGKAIARIWKEEE